MKLTRTLIKAIRYFYNEDYRFLFNDKYGIYNRLPDDEYLKRRFKAVMGKALDFDNPQTFNEKLQWLKLYNRNPKYTMMVDKYKVRDYIAETLGEKYLIPLLGVWDEPDDINFDELPNRFVLKCNHNSGLGMCICKDKTKLDIKKVKAELKKGLKQDYYLTGREWPYKNVPRKIIAEKFMTLSENVDLMDYKVHNFNGKPKMILVCSQRFTEEGLHEDFYSPEWEKLEVKRPEYPTSEIDIKAPQKLEEMLYLAEKLSKGSPFMRTDFYEIDGKLYFGEITLYPASGLSKFDPEEWDYKFGSWITLPIN